MTGSGSSPTSSRRGASAAAVRTSRTCWGLDEAFVLFVLLELRLELSREGGPKWGGDLLFLGRGGRSCRLAKTKKSATGNLSDTRPRARAMAWQPWTVSFIKNTFVYNYISHVSTLLYSLYFWLLRALALFMSRMATAPLMKCDIDSGIESEFIISSCRLLRYWWSCPSNKSFCSSFADCQRLVRTG